METERVSNTAGAAGVRTGVLWVLILLLATVFLTVGLSKLLGTGPIVFQAAAMHGFPNWIRVVVGGSNSRARSRSLSRDSRPTAPSGSHCS